MTFSKTILCASLGVSFLWVGCQKDNSLINNSSTNVVNEHFDYAPLSVGSTFTYEFAKKDLTTGEWKTSEMSTGISNKEDFLKQTWTVINHSVSQDLRSVTSAELNHCDGYVFRKLLKTYNDQGVSIKNYEIPMLKYPLEKGKTWKSQDFVTQLNGARALVFTMFAVRNLSLTRTVKGTTYNDVIHVDEEAAVEINGVAETIPVSRFYDKKVGLIEAITFGEHPVTHDQDTVSIQRLVRYDIK
jgi:hypothetical protein